MATTTIRLDERLKARVERLARKGGKSAHSFMLEAIAEVVEAAERRDAFEAVAEERKQRFEETGKALEWSDMRSWLTARAAGKRAPRPVARRTRR